MKTKTLLAVAGAMLLGVPLAWSQQPEPKPAQPAPPTPAAEPAPVPPPSLADIARQNRARKAKKVITDEDLPKTGGLANGSAVDTSAPAPVAATKQPDAAAGQDSKPATDKGDAADKADKSDKGEKTPASADADRMAYLEKDLEAIKKQIEEMKVRLDKETIDTRRATWSEVLERLQNQLQKQQEELDQLKSKPGAPKPQS